MITKKDIELLCQDTDTLIALLPSMRKAVSTAASRAKERAFEMFCDGNYHTPDEVAAEVNLSPAYITSCFNLRDHSGYCYESDNQKKTSCQLNGELLEYTINRTWRTTTKYYLQTPCNEDGHPIGFPKKYGRTTDKAQYYIQVQSRKKLK